MDRTARFLRALGLQPDIFRSMLKIGYRIEHHKEGWRRLMWASGFVPETINEEDVVADKGVIEAIVGLDKLDGALLQRLRGTLTFNHPPQAEYVLRDLRAEEGVLAVVNVQLVLERVASLSEGRSDETREQDKAAVATLADRGMDENFFKALGEQVERAQGAPVIGVLPAPVDPDELIRRQFEVHKWWYEWSTAARTALTNQNHLISLGLAVRGSGEETP